MAGSFFYFYPMQITLKNLIPKPIEDSYDPSSAIWNGPELSLKDNNYLVYSESGRGKTTLLSIFYGIRKDYSGNVWMDDKNIRDYRTQDWIDIRQRKIAMVFQGLALFDTLSVGENLMLKNRLTDYANEQNIRLLLEKLHVEHFWNKKVGQISFGQKQRVAIVRSLLQPFECILLDEAFSHLDLEMAEQANSVILEEVEKRNAFAIYTSLGERNMNDNFIKLNL